MPTFPTPDPILVSVELIGDVRITASDRTDTVVTVRPGDPSSAADVRAAEQTTVECRDGQVLIKSARNWRQFTPFGGKEAIDVTVELPTGSQLTVDSPLGNLSAEGELGECRLKTSMGNIRVDQAGPLQASTGYGNLSVDRVVGDAALTTGSGDVRVGAVEGDAMIKSSNGDTTIGEVTGELRVKAANGDVAVGRAHRSATARTANGDIRITEVRGGVIVVETAAGDLEVGIREGTAAWLDVVTRFGAVRNDLGTADGPTPSDTTVEVRARTSVGDIYIARSPSGDAARAGQRSDAR